MINIKILLFSLLYFSFCFCQIIRGNSILTLYNNREFIISLRDSCENIKYGPFSSPCSGELFKKYNNLSLIDWVKNSNDILRDFEDLCVTYNRLTVKKVYNKDVLINNDKLIQIVISLFEDTTTNRQFTVKMAYNICKNHTFYTLLYKYSDILKSALKKADMSEPEKTYLYLLCKLTELERNEFLKLIWLPLHFRARLGDTISEDSLISLYDRVKSFDDKSSLVWQLAYVGTSKCKKHLIIKFNEPIFSWIYYRGGIKCCEGSIRWQIIKALQKYYPESVVLNWRLNLPLRSRSNLSNEDWVKEYLHDFKLWAKKEYGVEPEGKDPEPFILEKGCQKD